MKRLRLWKMLALLLSVTVMVAGALSFTLAYVIAQSNTLHNTFRVEYATPEAIIVPVRVHKTVVCVGQGDAVTPGGFNFLLTNLNTGEITSLTTSAEGYAAVALTFTADDVGQTYAYRLAEVNDGRENVTYDQTVYDIRIALSTNPYNQMTADLHVNGAPVTKINAEFENLYTHADIPDTGDNNQPLLWLTLLLLSGTGLLMSKKMSMFRRPL